MLLKQCICEFNNIAATKVQFSVQDEVLLENKLKIIVAKLHEINNTEIDLNSLELNKFFTNIFNILGKSNDFKSGLILCGLDAIHNTFSCDSKLRKLLFSSFRFFPVLIKHVISSCRDEKVIKSLTVINDLLDGDDKLEVDDQNLHVLITVILEQIDSSSDNIYLWASTLANIISKYPSTKYVISKTQKFTYLREKITKCSEILSFKIFFLLEGILNRRDVLYFLTISLNSIRQAVKDLCHKTVKNSMDVMKCFNQSQDVLNGIRLSDNLDLCDSLRGIINDLLQYQEKISDGVISKWNRFLDAFWQFLQQLLILDRNFLVHIDGLIESDILLQHTTAHSINFLSVILQKGEQNMENLDERFYTVILSHLIEIYTGNNSENRSTEEKIAFYRLQRYITISHFELRLSSDIQTQFNEHYDNIIQGLSQLKILKNQENDNGMFIYLEALYTMSIFSRESVDFSLKLATAMRLDIMPVLIGKAILKNNVELMELVLLLAKLEDFPCKKVSEVLDTMHKTENIHHNYLSYCNQNNNNYNNNGTREIITNERIVQEHIENDLNRIINKVNDCIDCKKVNDITSNEIIELYRHKIMILNQNLNHTISSLQRSTCEMNELYQRLTSYGDIVNRQDCQVLQLHLENQQYRKEMQDRDNEVVALKQSFTIFQKKLKEIEQSEKRCASKLQMKEFELEEIEKKHNQVLKENTKRIDELKRNLKSFETQIKVKTKENDEYAEEKMRLQQKLIATEKENDKLSDIVKLHDQDLTKKQEMIEQLQSELKESEQVTSSIMKLMQSRSKNKSSS